METNKIYLGNAYEMIKDIPDKSIDLIITDPPYQIEGISNNGKLHGLFAKDGHKATYEKDIHEISHGIDFSILDEFIRVMKKINIYIWCNKEQIYDYLTYFVKERKCNWEMIIWAKDNPPPFTCGHYLKDKEYCLFFWEKGVKVSPTWETGKTAYITKTNVLDKHEYGHPTIKPLDLILNLIKNSTGGGAIILDPFVGSGTTCVAAKRLGRQYIGFEINEKYYKIACDRLNGLNQKGEMNLFDI